MQHGGHDIVFIDVKNNIFELKKTTLNIVNNGPILVKQIMLVLWATQVIPRYLLVALLR